MANYQERNSVKYPERWKINSVSAQHGLKDSLERELCTLTASVNQIMLKFWPLFPRKPFANLMEFYKLSTIYTSVIQFHPSVGQSLGNTPLTVFDTELNLSIISNVRRAPRVNISCKWKSEKAKVVKVWLQRQRRCSTSWPSTHLLHISQIYIFT